MSSTKAGPVRHEPRRPAHRESPFVIEACREQDERAWDGYVLAHPHGSPFHLTAWKRSMEQTFGYKPLYFVCRQDGALCGVLPLFLIENLLMGRTLLSVPFAVYGGALADSDGVRGAFAAHLARLGQDLSVQHIELRNAFPEQCLGFDPLPRYVTFTQELCPGEEALLAAIPRKTRYMVRRALKEDLTTRTPASADAFVDLYLRNLQKLGTPSFPRRHFERLLANFGKMIDIREVAHGGRVAAAVMTFYFRDRILPYYGASDPAFNALAPNNFMYFDLMRWGGRNGYRVFDFGRSKKHASGSYEFKAHWGMVERELPYEMLLIKRKTLPNYSPANPRFQLAMKLWGRLPPWIARTLGPAFIRLVP